MNATGHQGRRRFRRAAVRLCFVAASLVVASCFVGLFSGAGTDKKAAPGLPSPKVLQAWSEAGADFGWMRRDARGFGFHWNSEKEVAGAIPGFRFHFYQQGVPPNLPDPGVAFGVNLLCAKVTDEDLEKLARLKSLRWMDLGLTQVTGSGLKELAGLMNLHALDLRHAKVTDAGMKGLAGLTESSMGKDNSHSGKNKGTLA
jgi:hypothetical protein